MEEVFLKALHAEPADEATWLALADWLDDHGQPDRAELVRVLRRLRCLPLTRQKLARAAMQARVAELLASGVPPVVPEVVNSIGMRLALIPAGSFLMGSPDAAGGEGEAPDHKVEITRPFYLSVFPVTQAQWRAVMGSNPSRFCATGPGKRKVKGMTTDDFPVEQVSWEDARSFLGALSALSAEQNEGRTYRLPTEAQWEYACRGGASAHQVFHYGNTLSSTQANFNGKYPHGDTARGPYLERTCTVGSYRPNAFGLYDMHGNVWEWCSDWYAEDYYARSPWRDPQGPQEGTLRVIRGGSWDHHGMLCRSAIRYKSWPTNRYRFVGFRVAAVACSVK
jgi:uncharacterized protein (TIGR02996 family)